jgi:hypothetical protein
MTLRRPWPTVNVNATWYNTNGPDRWLVCDLERRGGP